MCIRDRRRRDPPRVGGCGEAETPRPDPRNRRLPAIATEHRLEAVSYTHLRAHETVLDIVCRLLLEKKNMFGCPIMDERFRGWNHWGFQFSSHDTAPTEICTRSSSAASDVYKRQVGIPGTGKGNSRRGVFLGNDAVDRTKKIDRRGCIWDVPESDF